jgi:hypothetical protein
MRSTARITAGALLIAGGLLLGGLPASAAEPDTATAGTRVTGDREAGTHGTRVTGDRDYGTDGTRVTSTENNWSTCDDPVCTAGNEW